MIERKVNRKVRYVSEDEASEPQGTQPGRADSPVAE